MRRTPRTNKARRDTAEWSVKMAGKVMTFALFVALVIGETMQFVQPVRLEIYLLLIAIFLGATNTVNVVVDRILGR